MELAVKTAFIDLRVVRPGKQADKYGKHFGIIADFLLGKPEWFFGAGSAADLMAYKFSRELVAVARLHGCKFVTPAVCANFDKMREAASRMDSGVSGSPAQVDNVETALLGKYLSSGLYGSLRNVLVNPQLGFPAWFRIKASGFDPDIVAYYMDDAKEEIAEDRELAEYLLERFPNFPEGTVKVKKK